MGYTHYWDMNTKTPRSAIKKMVEFTEQAIKLIEAEGIDIVGPRAGEGTD